MATAMYLEQYLDSLEALPCDLQRNFRLMRQLDQRSEDIKVEIDTSTANYIAKAKELQASDRVTEITKIQDLYSKCREYADDKVQLAMQTYEMVDKHIRRLDSDLARFEADLKDKSIQELTGTNLNKRDSDVMAGGDKKRKKKGRVASEDEIKSNKTKPETSVQPVLASAYQSSDVLDMPVDPNEPTYCLCHQVSYGEMIGCDNQDCPVEWYHFGCVNLTSKPKGKWFCPKCKDDRDKKKK